MATYEVRIEHEDQQHAVVINTVFVQANTRQGAILKAITAIEIADDITSLLVRRVSEVESPTWAIR